MHCYKGLQRKVKKMQLLVVPQLAVMQQLKNRFTTCHESWLILRSFF